MPTPEARQAALKADPRLDAYSSDEVERRRVTREMFDEAAAGYDEAERWTEARHRSVVSPRGTAPQRPAPRHAHPRRRRRYRAGDGCRARAGRPGRARHRPRPLAGHARRVEEEAVRRDARRLRRGHPLPDASVDFISMGYALRHVGDLDRAFAEYFRVLRPGGQVCLSGNQPSCQQHRPFCALRLYPWVPVLSRIAGSRADVGRLFGNTTATPSTLHWSRNRSWPRCVRPVSAMCAARSPSASSASTWRASPGLR